MKKPGPLLAVLAAIILIPLMAWWLWPPGPLGAPDQTTPTSATTHSPAAPASPALVPETAKAMEDANTASPPAGTPSPLTSTPTSADHTPLTPEQFTTLTERTLGELPTANDLRGVSEEEAHDYPAPLARAGIPLGRIAQAVHDQPSLKPQATRFYSDCAKSESIVIPVRALCYSHVIGDPQAPLPETLPSEVVRLAKLIPPESS